MGKAWKENADSRETDVLTEKNDEQVQKKPNVKRRIVIIVMAILFVVGVICCCVYYFLFLQKNEKQNIPERGGMEVTMTEDMVSASGITTVGIVEEKFESDYIESELYVEEVYVNSTDVVEAGEKILKLSEESISNAREELEDALTEADLAYRAGIIAYEQSKITAQYDYDNAILAGQQAQEVYDETVAQLQTKIEDAQQAVDEAKEQMEEYTEGLSDDNAGYDEEYQVTYLWNKYQWDLALLNEKVDEWGLAWESVTGSAGGGGGGGNSNLSLAQSLYQEVDEEYKEYNSAKEKFDSAVMEASYGLQKLQLQMTSLEADLQDAQNAYNEGLISAKADYDTAVQQAGLAQDNYDTAIKKAEEEIDSLEDERNDAQDHLDEFEERIGDGYMYTTSAGTVLMVAVRAETYLTAEGVVLAYSNTDQMTVSVSVDQADINKLTVGEVSYVVIEDGGNFSGSITSINPVSASNSRTSVTYTVTVQLEGDVSGLSANQSATVVFGMEMPSKSSDQTREQKEENVQESEEVRNAQESEEVKSSQEMRKGGEPSAENKETE